MTNKNIVNEFSRKIVDCIISPTYHIPSEIIMKFLITPVINKAIKTLYETDQSKMSKILDFVKHYFTQ
jgi:DNA-directed RNA polymerase subunit F